MLISSPEAIVDIVAENYLVFIVGKDSPSAETWNAYCDFIRKNLSRLHELRGLAITDGGGPTAAQRKELRAMFGNRDVPVAVISDATVMRFIVSSLTLFNNAMRTFSAGDLASAAAFLGAPASFSESLLKMLSDVRRSAPPNQFVTLEEVLDANKSPLN